LPSAQHIKTLDGLRGLAVLLVMSFHFQLNEFGWMGVQLFFVLSGYLIIGRLLALK
jgi:peptidoglycan/LPS O-acetylase OafA/YrhL